MPIANLINQVLIYDDAVVSDNPVMRHVDWNRAIYAMPIVKPESNSYNIEPFSSFSLFNGSRSVGFDNTTNLSLNILDAASSTYRLKINSGSGSFRVNRVLSSVNVVNVTVNNSVLAVFEFVGATLAGVIIGDILRVNSVSLGDTNPKFNNLNGGYWKVLSVDGTKVSCSRDYNESFSGVAETVNAASSDIMIYSSSGVQINDKIDIEGTFSDISCKTYVIKNVTPFYIDFVSTEVLPIEENKNYASNTISFYINSKKVFYLEANNDCVVRFNNDISNNNKVSPVVIPGGKVVGFIQKIGDIYKCEVVNKSNSTLTIKVITGE